MAMSASSAPAASSQSLWRVPAAWLFSSIGKKYVVALTGAAMVLFVIGHLLGNTTIFFGPDLINAYAMHLRDLGPFLWVIRVGLLAIIVLHIFFTMLLWKENQAARPQKYAVSAPMKTTVFARTMRLSGLIVLAFIAFHLAHFTLHLVQPQNAVFMAKVDGHEVPNVYAMVVLGFRNPFVSGFYIFALALVAFHLSHGIGSLFQTLGLNNSTLRPALEAGAKILAWALFVGYASIPISILVFGLGKGIVP
jgi:succinate dehydrogenase / fumarate reductase cytochrome b subunit